MKITDDVRFIKNVENLIDPAQVSDLFFFSSFKKLFPSALFKRMLHRTSKRFPYMGFVIDPYCLFLFFKLNNIEKAQALLPDRYRIMKASIFEGDEPEYYFGMGIFNTRASTFWGSRLEAYLIAEDTHTGITSWIFVDILSNTIIAHPRKGITGPNCSTAMHTTNSKGEVLLEFRHKKDRRGISLNGDLTHGTTRRLEQDLWIMGNASIGHSKAFSGNEDEPFAVIFDPAEVNTALDIPPDDLKLLSNTILPDFADPQLCKAACFPYSQHYIADSPGKRTFVKDPADMIEKYNAIASRSDLKTFSAKAVKIQFLLGSTLTGIASIILLIMLLLKG